MSEEISEESFRVCKTDRGVKVFFYAVAQDGTILGGAGEASDEAAARRIAKANAMKKCKPARRVMP